MKKALAVLVLIFFAFFSAAQTAKPPVFSATADFSTTANPNGAWSYGWSHTQGSAFMPFTLSGPTCCTGEEGWFGPVGPDPGYPMVVHNVEPPNIALDMAGGPENEFAMVRWTAPSTGTYHIVGVFYGFGSTLSDVHVLRGRNSLFDGNVAGLSVANFNLTAFFKAGATLDFAVHVTPQNFTTAGANTAMQVAISQGAMYKYQTYDVPNATGTWLRGINEYGTMVGNYTDADNLNHGFLLEGSRLTSIDFPGATQTYARSINNRRQIVGFFLDANSVYHGFLFNQGTFQQFDYPGALATLTRGINDRGQIVGDYMDETNIHAFILDNGKFTLFDYPGAPGTQGYGINNSDLIAGSYDSADWSTLHAYMTYNRKFVSFDAPGSTQTEFLGLNDLGQPVGYYVDAIVGNNVPFLFDQGQLRLLTPPGAYGGVARSINNSGVIVGNYSTFMAHGFLATPMR